MKTTFNEAVLAHATAIAGLVIRKQRDYGPGNIMRNHVPPELALCVRLSDKVARLVNLTQKEATPENETLLETWGDIVGYGLIGMMVTAGEFELPLLAEADEALTALRAKLSAPASPAAVALTGNSLRRALGLPPPPSDL